MIAAPARNRHAGGRAWAKTGECGGFLAAAAAATYIEID
jgi:hypothetical protein